MIQLNDDIFSKECCIYFLHSISGRKTILFPQTFLNQKEEEFIKRMQDPEGLIMEFNHTDAGTEITFQHSVPEGYIEQKDNEVEVYFSANLHYEGTLFTPYGIIGGNFKLKRFRSLKSMFSFFSNSHLCSTQDKNPSRINLPFFEKSQNAGFFEVDNKCVSDLKKPDFSADSIFITSLFHGMKDTLVLREFGSLGNVPYQYRYLFKQESTCELMENAVNLGLISYQRLTKTEIATSEKLALVENSNAILKQEIQKIQQVVNSEYQEIVLTAYRMLKDPDEDTAPTFSQAMERIHEIPSDGNNYPLRFQFDHLDLWRIEIMMSYHNSEYIGPDGCFEIKWPFSITSQRVYQAICDSLIYHCIKYYLYDGQLFFFFRPEATTIKHNLLNTIDIL